MPCKRNAGRVAEIIKLCCAFLFPLIVCTLQCWRLGGGIGDIYLPNSQNNDDLFYFKQAEGMIRYGIPQGFFGYDESRAMQCSFGAWGPFPLIVWAVLGRLLGWSISGYYLCNMLFQSLAFTFFTYQAKPKTKHMIAAGILIGLFPGYSKYTLSCLFESHMIAYLVFFYGLALGYVRQPGKWKIIMMFILGVFLTCARPYMVLLILLPGMFLYVKKKWLGLVVTGTVGVSALGLYFAMAKHWTAEYFTSMFDTRIFTRFLNDGFYAGARYLARKILDMLTSLSAYMKLSIFTGKFMGSNYCVLALICIIAFIIFIRHIRHKDNLYGIIYCHYVITVLISVAALLILMGKMNEGSRHIVCFIVLGCLLCSLMTEWKNLWRPIALGGLILFLFYYYPDDGQDYQIPLMTQERYDEQQAWNEIVKNMEVVEGGPSYDNTIIWAFSDEIDGNFSYMEWQPLLAMPAGMGISCCQYEYTSSHFEELKSRYIMTNSNGTIAAHCEAADFRVVGQYNDAVLYQRY